jgi:hypothetical protein
MRHTRNRRRFKGILIALLVLCFTFFIETRIEAFVPQLNTLAEARIESLFGDRVKLSMGNIEGGLLHPLAVNDIKLRNKSDGDPLPFLEISRITTTYRIWDIITRRESTPTLSDIITGGSHADIVFTTKRRDISGFARIETAEETLKCRGFVKFNSTGEKMDFSGTIMKDIFDVELRSGRGEIFIKGKFSDAGELLATARINRFKTQAMDITCDAQIKNKVVTRDGAGSKCIVGEFATSGLVLNNKPFFDIKASYAVENNVLQITKCSVGDCVSIKGDVSLKEPYSAEITALVDNVSVTWLLSSFGVRNPDEILSGTMSGKFVFKGAGAAIKSDVRFAIRKGTIGTLDFDNLSAILKGEGPVLRIEESRIDRQSGYFTLAGDLDMRKMGRESMFKSIKVSSDENAITWDAWEVKNSNGLQEMRMNKKLSDEFSLDFNRYVQDKEIDESGRHMDKVGLGYKLNDTQSLKVVMGQESDFFGLEHKDKF